MKLFKIRARFENSGAIGATASCIGKLSFDSQSWLRVYLKNSSLMDWFCENDHPINNPVDVCYLANTIFPQIAGLILMISVNALMVHYFLNGMNESGSVAGSAISMASNFSVSAAYGYFLFQDKISIIWMIGFMMIQTGIILLSTVNVY